LPDPPSCMFCGENGIEIRAVLRGKYAGKWFCPACLTAAIDALKAQGGE